MPDHRKLEQLSETVAFGVWTQDVVIAGDRLLANEKLDERETLALQQGRDLLRALADPESEPIAEPSSHRVAENGRAIATLTAANVRAPSEDARAYLRELAEALDEVLSDGPTATRRQQLDDVTELFSTIGQLELSRINDFSMSPAERPWRT